MEVSFIPYFLIKIFTQNKISQINLNILLSTFIVLIVFYLVDINSLNAIPHFCIFHKLTGIPCPACGITRSISSILSGNVLDSLKLNPSGLFVLITFVSQIPLRLIALNNNAYFNRIQNISKKTTKIMIFILLTSWFFMTITNI